MAKLNIKPPEGPASLGLKLNLTSGSVLYSIIFSIEIPSNLTPFTSIKLAYLVYSLSLF